MIKILIVDDEPIICQGLRSTIDWGHYGVEVVGEAYNGEEALEKINACKDIDIVLLDVMMPVMNGLEFVENLHISEYSPKVIMISGYEQFEYAKKAIRLGVEDYLLKPVDIDELLETVQRLIQDIQHEQSKQRSHHDLIIMNTVMQSINQPNEMYIPFSVAHMEVYPILSSTRDYFKVIKDMTNEEIKTLETNWVNKVERCLAKMDMGIVSCFMEKNILLTIVYQEKGRIDVKQLESALSGENRMENYYVIHGRVSNIGRLHGQYVAMMQTLNYATIRRKGLCKIDCPEENGTQINHTPPPSKLEDDIIHAIFLEDKEQMNHRIDKLFQWAEKFDVLLGDVLNICKQVLEAIMDRYQNTARNEYFAKMKLFSLQHADIVNVYNSYKLLQDLFIADICRAFNSIMELKNTSNWQVERAVQYMEEFYHQDIKAFEVADYINVSPNYFSALFKQQTGVTFNTYLNRVRIEKAKTLLLETPYMVNVIATEIGYQEYKYFAQVFKRMTSVTPTEFRNIQQMK